MNKPLESDIQNDCYEYGLSRGWFAEKIMRTHRKGFPDYFFLRDGTVVLVEFKRPGEKPEPMQATRHRQLRGHGGYVLVIDSLDEFKKVFK